MCSFPAWICIRTESGMNHRNGRFIIRALQICKKCSQLTYQEHTFIYNRTAAHRYDIGVVIALFKFTTGNIEHTVKRKSFFYFIWFFDKCLHDIRHTFSCFMSEHLRYYRNRSPSKKFQSFFFHNDLEHFFCLCAFDLMLWKKELCNTIFSLSADIKAFLFTGFFEKSVRNLQKDTYTISCLSFCILAGTMFQMLYDSECICNCIMSLFTFYIYNRTDTTVIMLKFLSIKSLIFSHYFLHIDCSFLSLN